MICLFILKVYNSNGTVFDLYTSLKESNIEFKVLTSFGNYIWNSSFFLERLMNMAVECTWFVSLKYVVAFETILLIGKCELFQTAQCQIWDDHIDQLLIEFLCSST